MTELLQQAIALSSLTDQNHARAVELANPLAFLKSNKINFDNNPE